MHVTVLGLGRMGAAMAARLADRDHTVTTWTRSGWTLPGLASAPTAAEAVAGADLVLLCLYDAAACRSVLDSLSGTLPHDAVIVNTATVGPDEAAELAAALGPAYLHTPVMGSTPAVAAGGLTLLAGVPSLAGPAAGVLADLGDVVPCGSPARAAAAKLVANGVLAGALLTLRDSRTRARELGLDAALTWDVLERTSVGGLVRAKRQRLDAGDLAGADFTAGALAKDVRLLAGHAPSAAGLLAEMERVPLAPQDDIAGLAAPRHGLTLAPGVTAPPEVLEPLLAYVAGHATGEASYHRAAFLPTAHVEGLRDGAFVSWTLDEFCALFTGKPADDEAERWRRIEHLSTSGSTGTAVLTLQHGADAFTDVFVLLRVDGAWRIANKAYHRRSG